MKRITFLLALAVLLNGCYRDDIRDLNNKYNDLKTEQERQADLLDTYRALLQALEGKLTVNAIVSVEGGYRIDFSDGTALAIANGHAPVVTIGDNGNWLVDGADTGKPSAGAAGLSPVIVDGVWHLGDVNTGVKAEGAPSIISIVEAAGSITFYMSDGSSVTMGRTETIGLYVLSEGTMGGNNGQLVFFDHDATTGKFTRNDAKRFREYAETPNDLLVYGSKMYCAITGSTDDGGLLRVINPLTGATISDIPIVLESVKQQPRRLLARGGKVYVTLYPGAVARVDTASLAVDVAALTGAFPEGICASGASLYICNSGQGVGNTISVVDIERFAETSAITVPLNPVDIVAAVNGEIFFNTATVWTGATASAPANIHVLDPVGKRVAETLDVPAEHIVAGKQYLYGAWLDWDSFDSELKKISLADHSVSAFTASLPAYAFAYKLALNPLNGDLFLTQQMGQYIFHFKEDGTLVETLSAGQQNGAAVAIINIIK
ncbi:MAG: DUF4988 domain-containing protein [Odoribacteraceae bacterium]|jgi:hypothetical protein|nr:DUF4988 domain-containing protein [Odoribacteraceae bacterium]